MKKLNFLLVFDTTRLRKTIFYSTLVLTGVLCAVLQSTVNLPYLSFFAFAPMMYCLCRSENTLDFIRNFSLFFAPYYFYQLVFLCTAYDKIPLPSMLSAAIMLVCVILLTIWEMILMFIPVCTFLWLRTGKYYDVFFLALLICGGEWLQEKIFFLSFPWSAVWLSVTSSQRLMQSANLLGCRLVTFIILSVSGLIAYIVMAKHRTLPITILCALVLLVNSYANYSLKHFDDIISSRDKISVICAQDNLEGDKKSQLTSLESLSNYLKILSKAKMKNTKLVLLPETAVTTSFDTKKREFIILSEFASLNHCTVISGCFSADNDNEYNAVCVANPDGSFCDLYYKQILVPFGEKIPLASLWGMKTLCECSDKSKTRPLQTSIGTIGTAVCIESIYPSIIQKQTKSGAQLICISTNDSWFGRSYARNLHFRHSIMRAVENGKYLLRAGNCGISSIISPTGEIVNAEYSSVKATVSGEISLISQKTFFTLSGDRFAVLPALLMVVAIMKRYRIKPEK